MTGSGYEDDFGSGTKEGLEEGKDGSRKTCKSTTVLDRRKSGPVLRQQQ